jgi:RNA polymerase-binding transcription factor DksA
VIENVDRVGNRDRVKTVSDSAFECKLCDDPIASSRRREFPGVQICEDCQRMLDMSVVSGGD